MSIFQNNGAGMDDKARHQILSEALLDAMDPYNAADVDAILAELDTMDIDTEGSLAAFHKKHEGLFSAGQLNPRSSREIFRKAGLVGGITHYIMTDGDVYRAAWISGELECMISGNLTEEELERIIDSIYE